MSRKPRDIFFVSQNDTFLWKNLHDVQLFSQKFGNEKY
jgi:hypothetical protein